MASPAPSPRFERLVGVWRSLALRSDIDDILLELLGRFSLEKIYAGPGDGDAFLQLVTGLVIKLDAIFYLQRLTLPAENVHAGRYLGLLASWEVTVRTVDFVLQSLLEARHSLVEGQLLRDRYLPAFLLSALRVLSLHPRPPTAQRAKDRRDRFARIHAYLEQVVDSYPGPKSFLLEACREVTGRLYADAAALGLPHGLRYGLPNMASELYPLAECLSPAYICELALPGEVNVSWLAQFLALRDVTDFVIGASVQYEAHRETCDVRLLSSCARSRDAVLAALDNLRLPHHLSKADMVSAFHEAFRCILPDSGDMARWDLSGLQIDEGELDALDALAGRLKERQIIHRVSDREMMHSISQVWTSIQVQDGLNSQSGPTWPALFAVNCPEAHLIGGSQLRYSDIKLPPDAAGDDEICLASPGRCPICSEAITIVREVTVARETWKILRRLEPEADTINVERHLPTQFVLSHPRPEGPGYFQNHYHAYPPTPFALPSSSSSHENGHFYDDKLHPHAPPTPGERSRLGSLGFLSPPSPDTRQSASTPATSIPSSSTNIAGVRPFEYDPDISSPQHHEPDPIRSFPPPPTPIPPTPILDQPAPSPQFRRPSSPKRPRAIPVMESPTLGIGPPPWQSLSLASSPEKEKVVKQSGWKSKFTGRRKTSVSAATADSSSLSELGTESQRLEEINLSGLSGGHKSSKGKAARSIKAVLSQHATSTLALFWSQSVIYVCDVSPSPPALKRAITTDSNCIIATVGMQYLAYIVGTRDQKLTLRIIDLTQSSVPGIEYRIPSTQWCKSIAIDQQENFVAVGFENSIVRWFKTTTNAQPPREDRLHPRHKDCKACAPVDTLSFSHDGLALVAGTRQPKTGLIQIYRWTWPFEAVEELRSCHYSVPLHESEDNGISSVIYRSASGPDSDLVCVTTWTQSGGPLLIQPQDGHRSEIRSDITGRHTNKLGHRIQGAAFSPSGRELVMVNDKGHLYEVSSLNKHPMDVKRIATSKELTTKSDAFDLAFMALPDEECVVLTWADARSMTAWIRKIPGTYQNTSGLPVVASAYVTSPTTPEQVAEPPSAVSEVKLAELEPTMSPVELPATPSHSAMGRPLGPGQLPRKAVAPAPFEGKW